MNKLYKYKYKFSKADIFYFCNTLMLYQKHNNKDLLSRCASLA